MKSSLWLLSLILLLIVMAMTLARRENSGWISFASDRDGDFALYVMTGDGASLRQISRHHTAGIVPGWSPDGRWLAFVSWPDRDKLFRIGVSGGSLRALTNLPPPITPQWSPDGKRLAVWRESRMVLVNADGSGEFLLAEGYQFPQFSPDGEWIYAVDFRPALLIQDVESRLDRIHIESGRIEHLLIASRSLSALSFSPDGKFFVLRNINTSGDKLLLMAADGSDQRQLSPGTSLLRLNDPHWSPDGEWIAFLGGETNGAQHIFRIRPDGSDMIRLTENASNLGDLSWSPDGEWLLFRVNSRESNDILRLRADGSSLQNLTAGRSNNYSPQYAPESGLGWHPVWVTLAALGMMILSLVRWFPK